MSTDSTDPNEKLKSSKRDYPHDFSPEGEPDDKYGSMNLGSLKQNDVKLLKQGPTAQDVSKAYEAAGLDITRFTPSDELLDFTPPPDAPAFFKKNFDPQGFARQAMTGLNPDPSNSQQVPSTNT